jgi:hypothetical protein
MRKLLYSKAPCFAGGPDTPAEVSSTIYKLMNLLELENGSWRMHLALTIMTVNYEPVTGSFGGALKSPKYPPADKPPARLVLRGIIQPPVRNMARTYSTSRGLFRSSWA